MAGNAVTPQPWFENQAGAGTTRLFARSSLGQLMNRGDMADFVQSMAYYGFIDSNVGMDSQFSENTYLTNKGFSSYNGLLLTVKKSYARGVEFQFNYTWSHSIDNVSANANFIAASSGYGFICDATRPRECRGDSDFDIRHQITSDFVLDLPVGRGRRYMSTSPLWLQEIAGGWSLSGIPSWHSGLAFNATGNAYVAGYANNAPVILTGDISQLSNHTHKLSGGSVNMFSNPTQAVGLFTGPVGLNIGSRNNLRGPSAFNFDAGLAKTFPLIYDRLNLKFRADAFNVLNHPTFGNPNADITSGNFGQITSTSNSPRVGQFSLRLEF